MSLQVNFVRCFGRVELPHARGQPAETNETPGAGTPASAGPAGISGYLCLFQDQGSEAWFLSFVPSSALDDGDVPLYEQMSEYGALQEALPMPTPALPTPSEALSFPVAQICSLSLEPLRKFAHISAQAPAATASGAPASSAPVRVDMRLGIKMRTPDCTAANLNVISLPDLLLRDPGNVHDWLPYWFALGMMDMRRVRPGSFEYFVSPKHQILADGDNVHARNNSGLSNSLHVASWSVLERFSKITKLSKDAAASVLVHPLSRPFIGLIPTPALDFIKTSSEAEGLLTEYEGAGTYLGWVLRRQGKGLNKGCEAEGLIESDMDEDWEVVDVAPAESLLHHRALPLSAPVTPEEWLSMYDDKGMLTQLPSTARDMLPDAEFQELKARGCLGAKEYIKKRIFFGGCNQDIRPLCWKYLLGIYAWDSTEDDRLEIQAKEKQEYYELKEKWEKVLAAAPEAIPVTVSRPLPLASETKPPAVSQPLPAATEATPYAPPATSQPLPAANNATPSATVPPPVSASDSKMKSVASSSESKHPAAPALDSSPIAKPHAAQLSNSEPPPSSSFPSPPTHAPALPSIPATPQPKSPTSPLNTAPTTAVSPFSQGKATSPSSQGKATSPTKATSIPPETLPNSTPIASSLSTAARPPSTPLSPTHPTTTPPIVTAQKSPPASGARRSSGEGFFGGDEDKVLDFAGKVRERKYRIEKDAPRTDRTVPYFQSKAPVNSTSPALTSFPSTDGQVTHHLQMLKDILLTYSLSEEEGYVQGMNDLLAPILVVMQNEEASYGCFRAFMRNMKANFSRDQMGMKTQLTRLGKLMKFLDPELWKHLVDIDSDNLFCSFRWLLVLFKREFEFGDIMKLWEVIWTKYLTPNFHLFVAFAIFDIYRAKILELSAFDDCLRFVNDLASRHSLEPILQRAEVLYYKFQWRWTMVKGKLDAHRRELEQEHREKGGPPDQPLSPVKREWFEELSCLVGIE